MSATYSAWHGDPGFKAAVLAEISRHEAADRITQGTYSQGEGEGWRGCAVGCTVRSLNLVTGSAAGYGDHAAMAAALGWPEWLARLEDVLFEGMPAAAARSWPGRVAAAVAPGADVSPVLHRFGAMVQARNLALVEGLAGLPDGLRDPVAAAVRRVLELHEEAAPAGDPRWPAARDAAWSAAGGGAGAPARLAAVSAARGAAGAAARSAAWYADGAAAWAAVSAAESTAESAAEAAGYAKVTARRAEYEALADGLVTLLAAVPGGEG